MRRVFDANAMRAPTGSGLDLAVEAWLAAPLLIRAIAYWEEFQAGCCPLASSNEVAVVAAHH